MLSRSGDLLPQFSVKGVKCCDFVEVGSRKKARWRVSLGILERKPIGAQSVVADIAELVLRTRHICDCHPLLAEMGDLLCEGERRFVEVSSHAAGIAAKLQNEKGPPSVHTPKGRGLAGSIAASRSGESPTKQ